MLDRTDSTDAGPSSASVSSSYSSSSPRILRKPQAAPIPQIQPGPSSFDTHTNKSAIQVAKAPLQATDHKKAKYPAQQTPSPPPSYLVDSALYTHSSPLGPSMLSSSSYKSINLSSSSADPDEPPRLITYTKHSQGFTWNDELFLPGYLLGRYAGAGHRRRNRTAWGDEDEDEDGDIEMGGVEGERCPVAEIFVTDEEAAAMMP
jgi:hypothetical protein